MNRRDFIKSFLVAGTGSLLPEDVLSLGEPDIDVYELVLEDFRESFANGVDELHTTKRGQ